MPKCNWPDCEYDGLESGGQHVSGVFYCWDHVLPRLQEEVIEGLKKLPQGECHISGSLLNRLSRLLESRDVGCPHKADIESRARDFQIRGMKVRFLIDRHPVGRVYVQEWEFDVENRKAEMLSEELVESEFKRSGDDFLCPECNEVLDITAGRALCQCGFERYHETHPKGW